MARQLVFTSAPQGLTPGRTGYTTVARHGDLRERLVPILESLSVYPPDWQPAPIICAFRLVDFVDTRVAVLSRIVNAGHDYTQRSHFLAHHLIIDTDEMASAPAPAEIFLRWPGWLNRWVGAPRWLGEGDLVNLKTLPPAPLALPANTWKKLTGDAGSASLLTQGGQPISCVLRCPAEIENDITFLFHESTALLNLAERWRTEFTTCLQSSESTPSLRWTAVRVGSPADNSGARANTILDLANPSTLPPVPATPAARLAREGTIPLRTPIAAPSPRAATPTIKVAAPSKPNVPVISPSPSRSTPKQSQAWLIVVMVALLAGGFALLWLLPQNKSAQPTTPPATNTPPTSAVVPINPADANGAVANEAAMFEIEKFATDGKFLAALDRWQELSQAAPEFAQTHGDVVKSRLLPGARKEWLATLDGIVSHLNAADVPRPQLATQLEKLQNFPHSWPVNNPDELGQALASTSAIFHFLDQLPNAPVWIADDLTPTAAGTDYQDYTITLSIPELDQFMASVGEPGQISATTVPLQSDASWFKFDLQAGDFSSGDYLVLPDASRGRAGGRFLQLLVEAPGRVRLTWRVFRQDSGFFLRYVANALLRPDAGQLMLHFSGNAPAPSFYLVLQIPGKGHSPWKLPNIPMTWLQVTDSPSLVRLPRWLANGLDWHLPTGESYYLAPNNNATTVPIAASLLSAKPAPTLGEVTYQAEWLIDQLKLQARTQQTALDSAQTHLTEMEKAASGPPEKRYPQPVIDDARQTVENIKKDLARSQAAADDAAKADWPSRATPWTLFYARDSSHPVPLLEFTPQ